jgi:hypothetical protein
MLRRQRSAIVTDLVHHFFKSLHRGLSAAFIRPLPEEQIFDESRDYQNKNNHAEQVKGSHPSLQFER